MSLKICVTCGVVLPETMEYFYKNGRYGLFKECKKCHKQRSKNNIVERYHNSAEFKAKVNNQSKVYYRENRLKAIEYAREYKQKVKILKNLG